MRLDPLESDILSSSAAVYFCTSIFNSTRAQVQEFDIHAAKKDKKGLSWFWPRATSSLPNSWFPIIVWESAGTRDLLHQVLDIGEK